MASIQSFDAADFKYMHVPVLKDFLMKRGVTCSIYKKAHLVRLCELAVELDLEVIESETQPQDDYRDMDVLRRTINHDDSVFVLPEVTTIEDWTADLTQLPFVESYDILIYLIQVCQWNESRMSNYKSDHGYRLFTANHIQDVYIHKTDITDYFYVKSSCVPETRQSEKPYSTWIIIKGDGHIKSGGCTCVVDNGTCKHITALLFSLENFSNRHRDRNTEVGTDVPCVWDKARKTTEPSVVNKIIIRNSTTNIEPSTDHYTPSKKLNISRHEIEKRVYNLCRKNNAVFLHTLVNSSDDETDDENETVPLSLTQLGQQVRDESKFCNLILSYHTEEILSKIEELTRGQSENEKWYLYRKGRITASNFHSVMHFKFGDGENNYILKNILQESKSVKTEALEYGKLCEPIARHQYFERYKMKHKCAKLKSTGLFVSKTIPYIGASPDGMVSCKCCGVGVIEIKCSFSFKNLTPKEICKKKYHVYLDENQNVCLRTDSPWYSQIQGQMGICNLNWCDFILYTNKSISVERINFDVNYFLEMVTKCEKFFHKYIKKALCT